MHALVHAAATSAASTRPAVRARSSLRFACDAHRHNSHPVIGYHYLHTALDDHCRLAYTELLADERKDTAAAFWLRAQTFFAYAGITVTAVLTDHGACHPPAAYLTTQVSTPRCRIKAVTAQIGHRWQSRVQLKLWLASTISNSSRDCETRLTNG